MCCRKPTSLETQGVLGLGIEQLLWSEASLLTHLAAKAATKQNNGNVSVHAQAGPRRIRRSCVQGWDPVFTETCQSFL